jgi:hypothetical protein
MFLNDSFQINRAPNDIVCVAGLAAFDREPFVSHLGLVFFNGGMHSRIIGEHFIKHSCPF